MPADKIAPPGAAEPSDMADEMEGNSSANQPHEHQWKFLRTDADWYDGDEEDVYECTVEGCTARDVRYIPR